MSGEDLLPHFFSSSGVLLLAFNSTQTLGCWCFFLPHMTQALETLRNPSHGSCGEATVKVATGWSPLEGYSAETFPTNKKSWTPCRWAWCGPCYKLEASDFLVERPKDEDGEEVLSAQGEETHYHQAHDGDNLCAPFQCEFCHFINLCNREPLGNYAPDLQLLKSIRRSNLDAFLASEPWTVKRVVDEAKRALSLPPIWELQVISFALWVPFQWMTTMGWELLWWCSKGLLRNENTQTNFNMRP